jgi:hypothetical protein
VLDVAAPVDAGPPLAPVVLAPPAPVVAAPVSLVELVVDIDPELDPPLPKCPPPVSSAEQPWRHTPPTTTSIGKPHEPKSTRIGKILSG